LNHETHPIPPPPTRCLRLRHATRGAAGAGGADARAARWRQRQPARHSFFSFNARDWSPSRIAWEARQAGLYAAAVCDFDVLDGMEEFLDAGEAIGLRAAAHLETRAFCASLRR